MGTQLICARILGLFGVVSLVCVKFKGLLEQHKGMLQLVLNFVRLGLHAAALIPVSLDLVHLL